MYKWSIKFILKNGVNLDCIYEGHENNSTDVVAALFKGKHKNEVIGFTGAVDGHNVFIVCGEIAAFDVSLPSKED